MNDTSSTQETSGSAAAAELHFQVTIDFTVSVHRLDEARIQSVLGFHGGRTPANDLDLAEELARDTRLIEALLKNKEALRIEALRRVIWDLDDVKAIRDIEQDLGLQETATDQHVLDLLAPQLPEDDVTYLTGSCDEDVFYDGTSFYQEVLKAAVGAIQIRQIDCPADGNSHH